MANETFPIPHQEIHNNTGLLWMLHAPFWEQMFFILMAAGIALLIHAMISWTDWKKVKLGIKEWILWMTVIEFPTQKEKRIEFFKMFKRDALIEYFTIKYEKEKSVLNERKNK